MKALAGLRLQGNRSSVRQMLSGLGLASGLMAAAWSLGATDNLLPGKSAQAATKSKAKANADVDDEEGQKFDGQKSIGQMAGEKRMKLNYVSAAWPRVLQDLADAGEMELVTDRFPTGRFVRRDKNEYTVKEAMRILNKELQPQGLRLLEMGHSLVLIRTIETRKEYPPAVLPSKPTPASDSQSEMARTTQFRAESISNPSRQEREPSIRQYDVADKSIRYNVPKSRQPNSEIELANERSNSPRNATGNRVIRQTGLEDAAEQEVAPPRRPHPFEAAPQGLDDVGAPAPYLTYKARHVSAVDLSKRIYRGLRSSAELIDSGRNGLPAFKVERLAASSDSKAHSDQDAGFMISIDDARNELLIDGTQKDISAVNKLLKVLDRPDADQLKTQIKSSTKYVCQVADQLPAEIDRLRAARGSDAVARRPVDGKPAWLADENQRRVPAAGDDDASRRDDGVRRNDTPRREEVAQQNRGRPEDDTQRAIGYSLGSFKGEVNIEVIEDLNVMIIRGNERDVEQILKVIQQIEKLSEATAPEVHLRYLKNVDADSLGDLLTSVYDRLTRFPGTATRPRQSAAIIPINKPNALLIVAPQADIEAILALVNDLDQSVDPETEFEVLPLKYAIADEMAASVTTFYQNRTILSAKAVVIADPRSNSLIVRALPRDLEEIRKLVRDLDRDIAGAEQVVRVFTLKNAVATELSAVINASIQSVLSPPVSSPSGGGAGAQGANLGLNGGQVDEQFKATKGTILKFLAVDKSGTRQLQSGILSDIRITPDAHANSLIVTATEKSMDLMEALIKALDRPTTTVSEIKVFTLANADATQMVQQLNALFNNVPQGGNQQQQQQRQQLGIALATADDASSSLVPLKFSVDTRTNSVIAVGSADALTVVQAIMLRLDESNLRARQNLVIRLNNAPVTQIAQAITAFFQQQRDLTQADPNLVSNVEQLEREVIVIPDTISNNLLVSASPRYFPTIEAMIKQLDSVPKQVVIQALIVEVALNNTDEFGVELGLQSPVLFDRSLKQAPITQTVTNTVGGGSGVQTTTQILLSEEGTPGFNFNNPGVPLGNNILASSATVGGQSLTNFSVGRTNGQLGYGGLVLSAGSDSVNALLRALSAKTKIQILSRPQIRALDSQQASVFVGQTIPTVTSFTTNATTGVISPNLTQRDTGIGLQVTPRINQDGNVVIQMYAYRSQLSQQTVNVTTDSRGQPVGQRITDLSNVQSTVLVPANSTIVIGGMISTRDEVSNRKAPFLGDIPILGQLFRYDSRTTARTELLIFLTPRIINGPEDEECFKEIEMGRMHFIESEAEEAHGPLRAVQPADVFDGDPTPWVGPGATPSLPNPGPPVPIQSPKMQGPGTGVPPAPPAASPPTTFQQMPPAAIPAGNESTPMNVPPSPPQPDPNITRINAVRAAATESENAKNKVSTANWVAPATSKKRAATAQRIFDEQQQKRSLNQTQEKN